MKPLSIAIIGAVVIVALILVIAFLGFIPGLNLSALGLGNDDTPIGNNIEEYDQTDIYFMLVAIKGSSLNYEQAMTHINALDMKAYGIDGEQYANVVSDYKTRYSGEGFALQGELPISGTHWSGSAVVWTKGSTAKSIVAGSGYLMEEAYGHDTLVLTGYGTYTQYLAFYTWITT